MWCRRYIQQKSSQFVCPVEKCSHSYSRRYNLQRHITSVHGDEHVVSATAKRFTCHIESCDESFYHASQLTQHYKMKHNMNMSKCKTTLYIMHLSDTETKFFKLGSILSWKEAEEESTYTFCTAERCHDE